MNHNGFRLGIQSYCFRAFQSIEELVEALKAVDLPYVEIWPGHIDYRAEWKEIESALDIFKREDIRMEAYGAVDVTTNETDMQRLMDFANLAGLKYITVVKLDEDAIPLVERLSGECGVLFAEHNHGRKFPYGSFGELRELFARTSTAFGLCLDAAWFLDSGEDPVAAVDEFRDRLYGVHLKDFAFDEQGNHRDVIIGTGGLDLPLFVKRLGEIGFDGYLSLEYEGDEHDPLPSTLECLKEVRRHVC